jgi:hypothetical protein
MPGKNPNDPIFQEFSKKSLKQGARAVRGSGCLHETWEPTFSAEEMKLIA